MLIKFNKVFNSYISCYLVTLFLGILFLNQTVLALPDDLKLVVTAGGVTQTLDLHKRTTRTADFVLYTWDSTNEYVIQPTPEVRTFKGTVRENPNALVFASIDSSNKLKAVCVDMEWGHNRRWDVTNFDVSSQVSNPQTPNPMPAQPVAPPANGTAGIPMLGPKVSTGISSGGIAYGEFVEFELGLDLPVSAYNRYNQKIDTVLANYELDALLFELMMARDLLVRLVTPTTVIRTENFYAADPGNTGLDELIGEWRQEPLVSARWDNVWSSEGHYAWGNGVGKEENSAACGALYHEVGHNWTAYHLAYQCDTMGGNKISIGPMTVDTMTKKRKEAINENKLPATTFTDPLPPHTHVDALRIPMDNAADIDVMANDHDANGDSLSIVDFTVVTVPGGVVTLNDDDTLHYVPAAGYVGKDIIVYTVQDDSPMGLKTRDVVHIEVVNNGLMVHYEMEDMSGTLASDSTGIGVAGDLNGANFSTDSVPSPLGKGIRADGTQDDNAIENGNWSGILVGSGNVMPVTLNPSRQATPLEKEYNQHSAYYDIMDGDYTFATWFRSDRFDSGGFPGGFGYGYIAARWWHPETRVGWDLYAINGEIGLHWRIFDGATGIQHLSASYNFKEEAWYHVAVVFDRSANEARIYVNGQVVATRSNAFESNGYIFNGRAPLALGEFGNKNMCFDDVRIYSKALSTIDVQGLYDLAGTGVPRFFESSVQYTAYSNLPFEQTLWGNISSGGDDPLSFEIISGPEWLSLSSEGIFEGTPLVSDDGLNIAVIRVTDSDGDSVDGTFNITVTANGAIVEYFDGGSGTISSLLSNSNYPLSPDDSAIIYDFEIPSNYSSTYGARIQTILTPTVTGNYTFWISADDQAELWFSEQEDGSLPTKIAYVPGYTSEKNWDRYSQQKSQTIYLEAGRKYYFETLFAEGSGDDHMAVAWRGPGIARQVISGLYLSFFIRGTIVAHWAMDETTGTVVVDSIHGYNGTLSNAPGTAWIDGQVDGSLSMDIDTTVVIGLSDLSPPWTAAMWVKRTESLQSSTIMRSSSYALKLEQYYNTHKVGITRFGHSDWKFNYSTPLNEWVHLTFVGTDSEVSLYADGVYADSLGVSVSLPLDTIGDSSGMVGALDDIKVYKSAFTSNAVAELYNDYFAMPPKFLSDTIFGIDALEDMSYNTSIAGEAMDTNGDAFTFSMVTNPSWLDLSPDGVLTGVPKTTDIGFNVFTVKVEAHVNPLEYDEAELQIFVQDLYDGSMGLSDFAGFSLQWDTSDCGICFGADLNGDGDVDMDDMAIYAGKWLDGLFCSAQTIHVDSVIAGTVAGSAGRKKLAATVVIYDNCGNPVEGVTVTGIFSGVFTEPASSITDSQGTAFLVSDGQLSNPSFTFCVDDLAHPTTIYVPEGNIGSCNSY